MAMRIGFKLDKMDQTQDIDFLKPNKAISDCTIDNELKRMKHLFPEVLIIPCSWAFLLEHSDVIDEESLFGWTKHKAVVFVLNDETVVQYQKRVDRILDKLPPLTTITTHWSLLVYLPDQQMFYHMDSSRGRINFKLAWDLSVKLASALHVKHEFSNLNCQKQLDQSNDCGVFTIMYARRFLDVLKERQYHIDNDVNMGDYMVGFNTGQKRLQMMDFYTNPNSEYSRQQSVGQPAVPTNVSDMVHNIQKHQLPTPSSAEPQSEEFKVSALQEASLERQQQFIQLDQIDVEADIERGVDQSDNFRSEVTVQNQRVVRQHNYQCETVLAEMEQTVEGIVECRSRFISKQMTVVTVSHVEEQRVSELEQEYPIPVISHVHNQGCNNEQQLGQSSVCEQVIEQHQIQSGDSADDGNCIGEQSVESSFVEKAIEQQYQISSLSQSSGIQTGIDEQFHKQFQSSSPEKVLDQQQQQQSAQHQQQQVHEQHQIQQQQQVQPNHQQLYQYSSAGGGLLMQQQFAQRQQQQLHEQQVQPNHQKQYQYSSADGAHMLQQNFAHGQQQQVHEQQTQQQIPQYQQRDSFPQQSQKAPSPTVTFPYPFTLYVPASSVLHPNVEAHSIYEKVSYPLTSNLYLQLIDLDEHSGPNGFCHGVESCSVFHWTVTIDVNLGAFVQYFPWGFTLHGDTSKVVDFAACLFLPNDNTVACGGFGKCIIVNVAGPSLNVSSSQDRDSVVDYAGIQGVAVSNSTSSIDVGMNAVPGELACEQPVKHQRKNDVLFFDLHHEVVFVYGPIQSIPVLKWFFNFGPSPDPHQVEYPYYINNIIGVIQAQLMKLCDEACHSKPSRLVDPYQIIRLLSDANITLRCYYRRSNYGPRSFDYLAYQLVVRLKDKLEDVIGKVMTGNLWSRIPSSIFMFLRYIRIAKKTDVARSEVGESYSRKHEGKMRFLTSTCMGGDKYFTAQCHFFSVLTKFYDTYFGDLGAGLYQEIQIDSDIIYNSLLRDTRTIRNIYFSACQLYHYLDMDSHNVPNIFRGCYDKKRSK